MIHEKRRVEILENSLFTLRWPSPMTSNGIIEKGEPGEDIDLFGSDDEDDEEKARITAARLKV